MNDNGSSAAGQHQKAVQAKEEREAAAGFVRLLELLGVKRSGGIFVKTLGYIGLQLLAIESNNATVTK